MSDNCLSDYCLDLGAFLSMSLSFAFLTTPFLISTLSPTFNPAASFTSMMPHCLSHQLQLFFVLNLGNGAFTGLSAAN